MVACQSHKLEEVGSIPTPALILGSIEVVRPAVNGVVVGSNPTPGV
jgi:hypothetical protein